MNRYLSIIFISLFAAYLSAQTLDTHTRIFDSAFRSLRAYVEGDYYASPTILLHSDDRIMVEFDNINPEREYLRYRVTHCDAMWQPSSLVESDYVDGFNEAEIYDYSFSMATFEQYVHYKVCLPNEDMPLLLSGNYLLTIYPEGEPGQVLLQQRFSIVEKEVNLNVEVTSRTDIDYNERHQQLAITVDADNYTIDNPYSDLKVVVTQNDRHDNAAIINTPLRVSGRKIVFDHNKSLIFPAGNEYRRFEMTTTYYAGMGVDFFTYQHPYHHAVLRTDGIRAVGSYSFDQTQFGRFTVRESDASDSDTQADYFVTHFSLASTKLSGGEIYLDGEFTQHNFLPCYKMHYNDETKCYELDIPLKQGAYNYQYLWLPTGMSEARTSAIEGDYYQTANKYEIKAYYRCPGERYDRLIGYGIVYSGR